MWNYIKDKWNRIKNKWNSMWSLLWSKTTVDEKAIATAKEIKRRYKLTARELSDVADAIKEVGNQIGDIDDAIEGKARRGRKSSKTTDSKKQNLAEQMVVSKGCS